MLLSLISFSRQIDHENDMKSCNGIQWLVLIAIFVVTRALYDGNGPTKVLDPSNFHKEIKDSGRLFLVEFYAPWWVNDDVHVFCTVCEPFFL